MDRLTTRSSASTRWSAWKAPRRPALRQPALPRKGAEVLRAGHGTRDRKALATWPMGEEVRFRDRAGPIALDIVAEVIFGVADNPRAERVRARAIAWLDTSRSTRRVIQTAWGDKPRRPLDRKLRPDHRLAAGGRGPGARGDRRAPPHERATQTHSTATDYRSLRRRARSRSMTTRGCVRTLRAPRSRHRAVRAVLAARAVHHFGTVAEYCSRSTVLRILPVGLRGMASAKITFLGSL